MTRVHKEEKNLESAFTDTTSCKIHFAVWFQPEIPEEVDLARLTHNIKDVVPYEFETQLDDNNDNNWMIQWKNIGESAFNGKYLQFKF